MNEKPKSIKDLQKHLQTIVDKGLPLFYTQTLSYVGQKSKAMAKDVIMGQTDSSPFPGVGPFPAHNPLSEYTIAQKTASGGGRGGDPHSILYDSGRLHDSVNFMVNVSGKRVDLGSNEEYASDMEYGDMSRNVSARPFLGPAIYATVDVRQKHIEKGFQRVLDGKAAKL